MIRLEKRIRNIEQKVLEKKHHGVFVILIENSNYIILNKEEKEQYFHLWMNQKPMYVKNIIAINIYIFISFNTDKIKKK